MTDPFKLTGPTCLSFSGGRTSAYMLWLAIQANGGTLPDDCVCTFANTGKEKEETLQFVRDCGLRWGVPIVWLEFVSRANDGFRVVSFETASRLGEPFDALIAQKQYLPNIMVRLCSEELKVKTIDRYLRSIGWEDYDSMLGIRADEPRRLVKHRPNKLVPLAVAGVVKSEVHSFWRGSSFDLDLPYDDGEGNCDLCFLKGFPKVMQLVKRAPERAVWWAGHEKTTGARFVKDWPGYGAMADFAVRQTEMFDNPAGEAIECFCGD